MDLAADWKLQHFDAGGGLAAGAHHPAFDDTSWTPARVPGDVHSSLLDAGEIPDPFFSTNIEGLQWVEEKELWYRCTFTVSADDLGEKAELIFEGLDTFAEMYLNGEAIGSSSNMFAAAVFDFTGRLLTDAPNCLAVRFDSTVKAIECKDTSKLWAAFHTPRSWVRKAGMNFGWDWGPKLVTVGIWRPVHLQFCSTARIKDATCTTRSVEGEQASIALAAEIENLSAGELAVEFALEGEEGTCKTLATVDGAGAAKAEMEIPRARLWWPHDLGEPYLYDLTVRLFTGGECIGEHHRKVGIRTVELLQEPDAEGGGKSFIFCINGVRTFCKGANWIPADNMIGRITPGRYRDHITMARKANMNMLRVWGGGIYEDDAFYDACDEQGMLVWQDFMFSCATYPDWDEAFLAECRREAEHNVRRLRSRPCLALWCGNNENQWLDSMQHPREIAPKPYGAKLYDEVLPEVCAALDPATPYWPGSPYGGSDYNAQEEGDTHNWRVWAGNLPRRFGEKQQNQESPEGTNYKHYAEDDGRFISEFGIHGSPVLRTLRRNVPDGKLEYDDEQFNYRIKDFQADRKRWMMQPHTGRPADVAEYEVFSMLCQAEGLKYGVEHFRRNKFHCSGALIWQLNDCWPCISWSLLDYYLVPKASYYYARRFFEPVLVSIKEEPGGLSVWLTNDTLSCYDAPITVALRDFNGEERWIARLEAAADPNESRRILSIPRAELPVGDPAREFLSVTSSTDPDLRNHYLFAPFKQCKLPEANVSIETESLGGLFVRLKISSDKFVRFFRIESDLDRLEFNDNYFDIFPGETRKVEIRSTVKFDPAALAFKAANMG